VPSGSRGFGNDPGWRCRRGSAQARDAQPPLARPTPSAAAPWSTRRRERPWENGVAILELSTDGSYVASRIEVK
jgi:hypothetical protein